jgi:hypothetical protein
MLVCPAERADVAGVIAGTRGDSVPAVETPGVPNQGGTEPAAGCQPPPPQGDLSSSCIH